MVQVIIAPDHMAAQQAQILEEKEAQRNIDPGNNLAAGLWIQIL